jgi:hypothetical protein
MYEQNSNRRNQRSRIPLPAACVLIASVGLPAGPSLAFEPQQSVSHAIGSCGIMRVEPLASRRPAAPVRLPPVQPVFIVPIAVEELHQFEPAPAVELDLAPPSDAKASIGGWIGVGYSGRGFFQ